MTDSFGARLKTQRESRHVTIEAIAAQTKIRVALLEGLERDDVSRWPDGLFRRSYLRSYAAAIGFDPEAAVREFVALYPEPTDEPLADALADAESTRTGRPRTRLQYLLDSALRWEPLRSPRRAVSKSVDIDPSEQVAPPPDTGTGGELAMEFNQASVESREHSVEAAQRPPGETGEPGEPGLPSEAVQVDLPALAHLCTAIVGAANASELEALLGEAARILHAVGIILWPWDPARGVLVPSISHGYPRSTLARLPTVLPDADNPVGAAFRLSACQVVGGCGSGTGAIVVPLTTPRGCVGVLAVECTNGIEQLDAVQALATILAAQLSLPVEQVQQVQQAHLEPPSRHAIA